MSSVSVPAVYTTSITFSHGLSFSPLLKQLWFCAAVLSSHVGRKIPLFSQSLFRALQINGLLAVFQVSSRWLSSLTHRLTSQDSLARALICVLCPSLSSSSTTQSRHPHRESIAFLTFSSWSLLKKNFFFKIASICLMKCTDLNKQMKKENKNA